jgi:polysaccharide biosynthesis protein PelG
MAGIGFALRKLTQRDDIVGVIQGYAHAAFASTGPLLLTALALGSISLLGQLHADQDAIKQFQLVVIYNFAITLIISGPVVMVVTRSLADLIYAKKVREAPGMLCGAMALTFAIQIPIAGTLYFVIADMDTSLRVVAVINFFAITGIWLASVFLSALKAYTIVSKAFAFGAAVAIGAAMYLDLTATAAGMLLCFSLGLGVTLFSLLARIFAEYPYPILRPFAFMANFRCYWELAASGFVYNLAIWIDKFLMWSSPGAEKTSSGLAFFPIYDNAMFLAYLTVVPSMSLFLVSVETSFYERQLRFFRDIAEHGPYRRILENQKMLIASIVTSQRNLIVLQASICLTVIMLAPQLFDLVGANFMELSIFRFGVLGSFFLALALFPLMVLTYMDLRRVVLSIQGLFLATNTGFTYWSVEIGFRYFGYGYFLAALTTFIVASLAVIYYLNRLP